MLKKAVVIILIIGIAYINLNSFALGKRMPYFQVESGDEVVLNSNELANKVIFFFYDHKDSFQYNNEFKTNLFREYKTLIPQQKEEIAIVQIIDCSSSNFINRYFYKNGLINNSKKYGFRIWGDWDGKVRENFGFKSEQSYMIIFDKSGKAVYLDQHLFQETKIREITRLLDDIFAKDECR